MTATPAAWQRKAKLAASITQIGSHVIWERLISYGQRPRP